MYLGNDTQRRKKTYESICATFTMHGIRIKCCKKLDVNTVRRTLQ